MDESMEKKADALLDEREDAQENAENHAEDKAKNGPEETYENLRKLCKGTLKLMVPFRAHGTDVTEVPFDFCALTGEDMMNALDEAPANNILAITNGQAMALFAAAAEKCAPTINEQGSRSKLYDAKDVRKSVSGVDFLGVMRIAKLFYSAAGQAGSKFISKE